VVQKIIHPYLALDVATECLCDTYLVVLGLEEKVLWLEISVANVVLVVAVFDRPVMALQHSQVMHVQATQTGAC